MTTKEEIVRRSAEHGAEVISGTETGTAKRVSASEALRVKAAHFRDYASDNTAMVTRRPKDRKELSLVAAIWRGAAQELENAADAIAAEEE